MLDIEAMSLFCEDVRWEQNGSPMVLGIMAPVFHAISYPVDFEDVTLFTHFKCAPDVKEFEAELLLDLLSEDGEERVGAFDGKFVKGENTNSDFQWVAISTLRIEDLEMDVGQTLRARINVEERSWTCHLTAGKPRQSQEA